MARYIIHTLVKATVLETVCHFRTQVSAIVTHFLQAVFLTVHYVILLRQLPSVLFVTENAEPQEGFQKAAAGCGLSKPNKSRRKLRQLHKFTRDNN